MESSSAVARKVCVYIDGFNLYHAIAALRDQRLKWLNMHSLGSSYLRPGESLERVYFFTAILTWNHQKQARHKNYIEAQKASGVRVVEANFKKVRKFCMPRDQWCKNFEEKQTDVAIATTMLMDAMKGRFDRAVLITADSDQIPTVRALKSNFPRKTVTLSAPPGRADMARELGAVVTERKPLTEGRLHAHRLPRDVFDSSNRKVATMPALYDQ